ncbi:hypothetical protein GF312_17595 [Candidatus Poribacteria bacterium]|nr:hypothetical protein [Candidatus Poribacteria bacterium]
MAKLNSKESIKEFMEQEGYEVEEQQVGDALVISDEDGFTIFTVISDMQVEFMVDICGAKDLQENSLLEAYSMLLDQNTEILPTCYGIDTTDPDNHRIVLVDSLALENLDANELQLSLSSLAQNTMHAVEILSPYHKTFSANE